MYGTLYYWFSKVASLRERFQGPGKKPTGFPFIKNPTDIEILIIVQYPFCQSVVKYLKESYIGRCHNHFNDNFLLRESQSRFRYSDSCVNQLLSIANKIYSFFDNKPSLEIRGVFLDISLGFDRVGL